MIKSSDYPILATADVVVCGGGPAGAGAALAAARNGYDVLILEQTGALGGMGTVGLVPAIIHVSDGKNLTADGICREIVDEMCRRMGVEPNYGWQNIDPEILKVVYDEKIAEAGIRVVFNVKICEVVRNGERVESVLAATSQGLKRIVGKTFVDATGDAAVAAFAGVPFERGDAAGNTMSPSLCVQYANVDFSRVNGTGRNEWIKLMEQGKAPLPEYHFVGFFRNGKTMGSGNLGHIYGIDCLDEFDITKGYIEGRKIARIIFDFYREHVPGYENAELVSTASSLSVRETRRITGDYQLNHGDYKRRARFDDEVGRFSYPVDIHASSTDPAAQKKVEEVLHATRYEAGENYGIPYRSLCPQGVKNLLVAGRSICADRAMQSSIRVMPGCFVTGQACGVAAGLSLATGDIRRVEIETLRAGLKKVGAYLG